MKDWNILRAICKTLYTRTPLERTGFMHGTRQLSKKLIYVIWHIVLYTYCLQPREIVCFVFLSLNVSRDKVEGNIEIGEKQNKLYIYFPREISPTSTSIPYSYVNATEQFSSIGLSCLFL
jgi:hypothetical protein